MFPMHTSELEIYQASILVIDDSSTALSKMKRILMEEGFVNIHTCQDPENSVRVFEDLQPDLVILDYNMPSMNGQDVLDELYENNEDDKINVLFWTALSEKSLVTEVLNNGAKDVLGKNDTSDQEVIYRVRNQIESYLTREKLRCYNEKLNEEVKKRALELQQTSMETIERLVKTAEFRDNETAGHIERIGLLARRLADLLGLDQSTSDALLYGAPMHDIGKMGVPDEILFKPDSLNDEEWEEMKKHSVYGARILSGSDRKFIQVGENIARYHHEYWNGDGYPYGLEETKIPLEARVTAVCDVFDAVLSDRPYKEPWSENRAVDLIKEEKGEQFDPDIAECFLENADEMIAIRNEYDHEEDDFKKPENPGDDRIFAEAAVANGAQVETC
jgi:putative two-component system response regulator